MEEDSRSQKQTPFEAVEKALEEKLVAIKAEDLHLRGKGIFHCKRS